MVYYHFSVAGADSLLRGADRTYRSLRLLQLLRLERVY